MAAMEKEDPDHVRAAQILVSLQRRKLRKRPEWVPTQRGKASSSPGTVAVAAKVMPSGEAAGPVAAGVPLWRRQPGVASLAGTAVAARVPERWPKAKRSGLRGETLKEELEQCHAAAAAAKGSGAPRSSEQERCAEMPAPSALCYATVAVAGSGPSTAAPAKEPMETTSPDTPLDYGAGGSGAPSSVDDAAPARPQAKPKGTGARRSVGGGDDEGCSSPAKRGRVAQEEKPTPISVEPSVQSQTRASSGKGAPRTFDLNLPPCPLDEDDDGCPDTS